ncbi:DUF692 domain-containing protein [Streptomyces zhaozhouensis]|uniref:DUF692 domain-containing protein n=1 Tax=Streptomyces zhaozhouensis TaxID=1300267 RepID=UPI000BE37F1C|nr:DUF692 domain-containing protein [Streptomyces zhaozhouensis]
MPDRAARTSDVPRLGTGLGYRSELHDYVMAGRGTIEWLEIITDNYLTGDGRLDELRALREDFTVIPHGLEMSVGSEGPLDLEYVDAVARVADAVDAPWFSDHLCFTREAGIDLGNLVPTVQTLDKARGIAARAQQVQDRVGRPFLLENIATYLDMPGELSQPEMIRAVLDHCDCGLLLDLNNVVVNCVNHGFDPYAYLARLPLDRVVQVHLAGNTENAYVAGLLIDSHDAPVGERVFALLEWLLRRRPDLPAVMIERDSAFAFSVPEIDEDLRRTRDLMARYASAGAPR